MPMAMRNSSSTEKVHRYGRSASTLVSKFRKSENECFRSCITHNIRKYGTILTEFWRWNRSHFKSVCPTTSETWRSNCCKLVDRPYYGFLLLRCNELGSIVRISDETLSKFQMINPREEVMLGGALNFSELRSCISHYLFLLTERDFKNFWTGSGDQNLSEKGPSFVRTLYCSIFVIIETFVLSV